MADEAKEAARRALVDAAVFRGYPASFGELLANELGGEWSMRRMTGYLRQAGPETTLEDVADELLAILSERDAIVARKRSEQANAAYTAFLNREQDD